MTTTIEYTATIDGVEKSGQFTPDDVSDPRAGWNPEVAEAYAQHVAVDEWGQFDVSRLDVRLREDHSQYDETGGVPL